MTEKKNTKPKKTAAKKSSKVKPKSKPKKDVPEIWKCIRDWVQYRGKRYQRGDTIMIMPSQMSDRDMEILERYFEKTETESVKVTSEPIEPLEEGADHASD